MQISVVIPTYNNCDELKSCLGGLGKQTFRDFEVFVCVDGSTDETLKWLHMQPFDFPLRVLTHPENQNRGRAATRNLTIPHIRTPFILFLDSDMVPLENLISEHLRLLTENSGAVSVGIFQYVNGSKNIWARYLMERGIGKFCDREKIPWNYLITPNTAMPAEYFIETGGFDEHFRHYGGEDMELGYRIRKKFKPDFVLNAKAVVQGTEEKTLADSLRQLEEYGRTGLRYINNKYPELEKIYLINRLKNRRLEDRWFNLMKNPLTRAFARAMVPLMPHGIRKFLINFLVIDAIHRGYRKQ